MIETAAGLPISPDVLVLDSSLTCGTLEVVQYVGVSSALHMR